MGLSPGLVDSLARELFEALNTRRPVPPLSVRYPDADREDAYAIQLALIRLRREKHPAPLAGWKVGLTSKAMQQMLDIEEPDFGHLFEDMLLPPTAAVDCADFIWPRVEPETAFILKSDLAGPDVGIADVLDATEYVVPALELIDSRIKDWKIGLVDTVADNASCGRVILGAGRVPPAEVDVALIGLNFYVDEALMSTATSAAVLGNPAASVAWLANTLAGFGETLHAGQLIMPGSLVAAVDAKPGRRIRAEFAHLGPVAAAFN